MRRASLLFVLLALSAGVARADDPPAPNPKPPEPVAPKPTRLAPPPAILGVRWERDFKEGMRRAALEGRPVFVAVNALEDQPGGKFPWPEEGVATRPYVCFVANGRDHATERWPDGTEVCSHFGTGTCACHKHALEFAIARFSTDGQSVISPSHGVLDPDGEIAFHGDYIQSAPTPAQFDAILARTSPRLASRAVWTSRDERMTALGKAPTPELLAAAAAWIGSGDALAAAGVAALLDQETDAARREALGKALEGAGPAAAPALFDAVDAATGKPDADPAETLRLVRLAIAVDPALGAYALARVVARAKDPELASKARACAAALPADKTPKARPRRGDPAAPLAAAVKSASRDERRAALLAATRAEIEAAKDVVAPLLRDPIEEVRVAAAIALRRVGDPSGTEVLLVALADPVEGPEAHEALVAIAGKDLGDEAAAWEAWLREGKGGAK